MKTFILEGNKPGVIQEGERVEIEFKEEYELARKIGDERFGSECEHNNVKSGRCVQCLRKVE